MWNVCENERRLRDSDWEKRQRKSRQKKWRREGKRGRGRKGWGFLAPPFCSLIMFMTQTQEMINTCEYTTTYTYTHTMNIAPDHHLEFRKPPTATWLHHSLLSPSLWASSFTSLSLSHSFSDYPSLFFSLHFSPNLLFLPFLSLHQYIHLSFISSVFCKTTSVK